MSATQTSFNESPRVGSGSVARVQRKGSDEIVELGAQTANTTATKGLTTTDINTTNAGRLARVVSEQTATVTVSLANFNPHALSVVYGPTFSMENITSDSMGLPNFTINGTGQEDYRYGSQKFALFYDGQNPDGSVKFRDIPCVFKFSKPNDSQSDLVIPSDAVDPATTFVFTAKLVTGPNDIEIRQLTAGEIRIEKSLSAQSGFVFRFTNTSSGVSPDRANPVNYRENASDGSTDAAGTALTSTDSVPADSQINNPADGTTKRVVGGYTFFDPDRQVKSNYRQNNTDGSSNPSGTVLADSAAIPGDENLNNPVDGSMKRVPGPTGYTFFDPNAFNEGGLKSGDNILIEWSKAMTFPYVTAYHGRSGGGGTRLPELTLFIVENVAQTEERFYRRRVDTYHNAVISGDDLDFSFPAPGAEPTPLTLAFNCSLDPNMPIGEQLSTHYFETTPVLYYIR